MNLIYTGVFENFYALPLSREAQDCVEGYRIQVDRWFAARGAPRRYARVLKVVDGSDGRRVTFQEDRDA